MSFNKPDLKIKNAKKGKKICIVKYYNNNKMY